MEIILPETRRGDSLLRRIRVTLFNWIFWFLPATLDAWFLDVGREYQMVVVFLFVLTVGVELALLLILFPLFAVGWWWKLLAAFGFYLFVGMFYHHYERKWNPRDC